MQYFVREGIPFSLMMVDLDYFKKYNDSYGHLVGDEALKQLAGLLRDEERDADIIGKYGGEEFVALLPGADLDGAVQVGERMRKRVERETENNKTGRITVSVGVTEYKAGDNLTGMIGRADQALYQAKQEGRNRVIAIIE